MKLFLRKITLFTLIGLIPIIISLIGYFHFDPFKVLKPYKDYSNSYIIPNRDYISTEIFLKNKNNCNSFIFGSSRTIAFRTSSWKKYLDTNSKPFLYDASSESVYGIYKKIKYIDSLNININNVLIILCRDYSFENDANHKGHLFIKHPAISGESELHFQLEFYKAYLNPKFIFCFYNYTFTKKYKNYMKGFVENNRIMFDTTTNEINEIDQESQITKHPIEYYADRNDVFYFRKGERVDSVKRINKKQLFMLNEIKHILNKNKSKYKVVISPLYEQVKLNPNDLNILQKVFGKNLYDYSGKNSFSELKTNFYEASHYRPDVGEKILFNIYRLK
ncbi:hypothetical protein [Flavobacterium sp.]|uniref:hypothetical protein n=1 Tax=Flavobacterium sp. TaxID=239 RepID=UPI003752D4B2